MSCSEYKLMYQKLYRLFRTVTPLKKDCGVLCGGACCRGDDRTGMLLFPHEETNLQVIEENGLRYAVCQGVCRREDRPLSCRIFPFFPAVDENGRVYAVIDERGRFVCPLVRQCDNVKFRSSFLRRVKKAGILLAKDEDCLAFLRTMSGEISETSALAEQLKNKRD